MEKDNKNRNIRGFLQDAFRKAVYLPALALVVSGPLISYDYLETQRPDLLIGGILLTALGAAIIDNMRGKNYLAKGLSRLFNRRTDPIQQGSVLAVLGLGACAVLGGTEALNIIGKHGLSSGSLADPDKVRQVVSDPAFLKILANVGPFALASALDIPKVYEKVSRRLGDNNTRILQAGLSLAGAVMMGVFGFRNRIFSARFFGVAGAKSNLLAATARASDHMDQGPGARPAEPAI